MSKGLVSCIMATRDERLGLAQRAIINFHAQTYEDKELIVVCRSVHLFCQLDRWAREHGLLIRAYTGPISNTVRDAWRLGISHARGEWFTFWDDDNQSHPNRLERQMLEAEKTTPCLIVAGMWHFYDTGELFFVNPERRGKKIPWRVVPYSAVIHKDIFPGVIGGKEHPIVDLLYWYWKNKYLPTMIREEYHWMFVGVRGDNKRGYEWHRGQALNGLECRDVKWLEARKATILTWLDAYNWSCPRLFVCCPKGIAFEHVPQLQWPSTLAPIGEPDDADYVRETV